jgi:hypothetical protein
VFGSRISEGWTLDQPGGAGLKPGARKNSFWVNIIGRGNPPPNRTFRWRTERMKIDPVGAEEFITSERSEKPIKKLTAIAVRTIHPLKQ